MRAPPATSDASKEGVCDIPVLVAVLGVVVIGQEKLTTTEDYAKNMKANAQAVKATRRRVSGSSRGCCN